MLLDNIQTISVCGAGTMGSGIAQVFAQAGYKVVLFDINHEMLQKGRTAMEEGLQRLVEKGKLKNDEKRAILQRLLFTTDITFCKAQVVVEAVAEKMEIKTALFQQLAQINDAATLFASNTSSLSITALQQQVPYPQRMGGLHFFNPAPVMKLVEVIKGQHTSDQTISTFFALSESLGKTPVACTDSPGFIVNRVARPYYLEAMRLVSEGVATIEEVDAVMEATGFKLGPFRLMDLIGLDINYAASQAVYEALERPDRLQPSSLQKQKIDAGHLGRKTGKGFYDYP